MPPDQSQLCLLSAKRRAFRGQQDLVKTDHYIPMHTIMKSLLVIPILLLAGCTSYSIYGGDPAQRQLRNQWSANYELCERLTVATLAPEKIRAEWTNEITGRSVDCALYAATTHTAVNRDMPFLRWSTQWTAPRMTSTIPAPSQLIHAR